MTVKKRRNAQFLKKFEQIKINVHVGEKKL